MNKTNSKTLKRARRHKRIRARVSGTAERPRLAVFKSNKFMYAQLIDDTAGKTLASASDIKGGKGTKVERSTSIGTELAEKAKALKITSVVFDRGGFRFTGRVKALADAARSAGLNF
jgi:large subunit ribosomal protein L18